MTHAFLREYSDLHKKFSKAAKKQGVKTADVSEHPYHSQLLISICGSPENLVEIHKACRAQRTGLYLGSALSEEPNIGYLYYTDWEYPVLRLFQDKLDLRTKEDLKAAQAYLASKLQERLEKIYEIE